jgi:glycosyltransferase involved in cell wall biosynthesis
MTAQSAADLNSRARLRVLAICPYAPYPPFGGGKMRIYHLLQEWMKLGHEVTVAVSGPADTKLDWSEGDVAPELIMLPGRVRGSAISKVSGLLSPLPDEVWARPLWHGDEALGLPARFDIVVLMQAHVGQHAAPFLKSGVPVILDQQNVESHISTEVARLRWTRMGRARARLDTRKWRAYERSLLRKVQRTVAVSEADAQDFRNVAPSASVVVRPSGADLRSVQYVDHSENRADSLLMTGTLGYLPNLDAAVWMIERILPRVRLSRPSAHLVLVGSSAPASLKERGGDAVDVVGQVPDVRPFLDQADLFVAPLRAGGGTRLKLLEAFAAGIPTVATTIASSGITVRHGIDVATADDEETFANAILRMLEDVAGRRAMAESARRLVQEHYDWRAIAADYEADLYEVVAAAAAGSSRSIVPVD